MSQDSQNPDTETLAELIHELPQGPRTFVDTPRPRPRVADAVDRVAPLIHAGELVKAARAVMDFLQEEGVHSGGVQVENTKDAYVVLLSFLKRLLDQDLLAQAAAVLWPPTLFDSRPRSVRMIWQALEQNVQTLFPGASSMGKTYTPGVYFFLKWLQDPQYTNVLCVGPTEEHLESNLFSHLTKLHTEASLPLPGTPGKRFIGHSRRNLRAGIRGIVIPVGKGASGRIQGTKRHPRPVPHPRFGTRSRLFILIDELENVPEGVNTDLENVVSVIGTEPDGFRIAASYNPKDITKKPYRLAEPPDGWLKFDPDTDELWLSKQGWNVCRLDALRSENVVTGREQFLGLQTREGVLRTLRVSGGAKSPGFSAFVRGCYPLTNLKMTLLAPADVERRRGEVRWATAPTPVGGVDLALEGGDTIPYAHGMFGQAVGVTRVDGMYEAFMFQGRPISRPVLQLVGIYPLDPGPAPDVAENVKKMAQAFRTAPDCLTLDRTGNGAGPHDILRQGWDTRVRGVNFWQACSNQKILEEDLESAEETCHRRESEMAFALREWVLNGYLWIHPDYDTSDIVRQLCGRMLKVAIGKRRIESKADYKKRNSGQSPNEADALGLLVDTVRMQFAPVISAAPTSDTIKAAAQHPDSVKPYVDEFSVVDDIHFDPGHWRG